MAIGCSPFSCIWALALCCSTARRPYIGWTVWLPAPMQCSPFIRVWRGSTWGCDNVKDTKDIQWNLVLFDVLKAYFICDLFVVHIFCVPDFVRVIVTYFIYLICPCVDNTKCVIKRRINSLTTCPKWCLIWRYKWHDMFFCAPCGKSIIDLGYKSQPNGRCPSHRSKIVWSMAKKNEKVFSIFIAC